MDGLTKEEHALITKPLGEIIADGQLKMALAVRNKRDAFISEQNKKFKPELSTGKVNVISDSLGHGVQGVFNHADGRLYDSKSSYEKAVKAKGCHVVGNDWNKAEYKIPLERGVSGDFNVRKELKEVVQKVVG